ncbi:MAG: nucleotidyltransferase family protein [Pyrinomonadaceae bacterium]
MDDSYRWYLLKLKQHELLIVRAFRLYREHGIEPILIKGWAAAKLYPNGVSRFFGDTDLVVSSSAFDTASQIYKSSKGQGLNIDLHNEFRHLDTEKWENLFNRSVIIDLDGTAIRVLCPEDHFRVLCVHWLNDGGEHKIKLWDIYYAVHNRGPGFDWDLCLGSVSQTRRRWIICAVGLAHKYLGLGIDDLPFAAEAKRLPKWLERTVEREWASPVRLRQLSTCLGDRKLLIQQIRKRLPPNPIEATIEMEGSFDSPVRIHYQIGSIAKRIIPSLKTFSYLFRDR